MIFNSNNIQKSLIELESPAQILRKIKSIPKIDLHRHLTGSIDAALAIEISSKYDIYLPTYIYAELNEALTKRPLPLSHEDYFKRWEILNRLFVSAESTYDILMNVIRKASDDNVVYMELRMGPRGFLGNKEFGFEEFIKVVATAVIDGEEKYGIVTRCILGISRHETFSTIKTEVRDKMFYRIISCVLNYHPLCFVGVDLNGIESESEDGLYTSFYKIAKKKNLKITVHAGELESGNNILRAIETLGADRIGHGLAAAKEPMIMESLAKRNIALEICPSSNHFLGIITNVKELPLKRFNEYKVPYIISTDNPAICQTSMTEELFKIYYAFDLSFNDLKELIIKSLNYSFADKGTKTLIAKKL